MNMGQSGPELNVAFATSTRVRHSAEARAEGEA